MFIITLLSITPAKPPEYIALSELNCPSVSAVVANSRFKFLTYALCISANRPIDSSCALPTSRYIPLIVIPFPSIEVIELLLMSPRIKFVRVLIAVSSLAKSMLLIKRTYPVKLLLVFPLNIISLNSSTLLIIFGLFALPGS